MGSQRLRFCKVLGGVPCRGNRLELTAHNIVVVATTGSNTGIRENNHDQTPPTKRTPPHSIITQHHRTASHRKAPKQIFKSKNKKIRRSAYCQHTRAFGGQRPATGMVKTGMSWDHPQVLHLNRDACPVSYSRCKLRTLPQNTTNSIHLRAPCLSLRGDIIPTMPMHTR